MSDKLNRVFVSILDKEYQVACPPEERDALLAAAKEMDARMRNIRNAGGIVGIDRIAVMVGLNLCHELHNIQKQQNSDKASDSELKSLVDKLDLALRDTN